MIEVGRLRALHAVASYGTVLAAGDALHCTPSAVSQQLAKLERETGATLIEKDGRRLRLTEAGRVLAEHAERVLATLDEAEAALAAHRDAGYVGSVLVPWGLVLAVLASALPSTALVTLGAGRAAVGGYGGGWCLVVLVLVGGRPEGDYVVAGDFRGWGFLVVATLAVVAVTLRGLTAVGPGRGPAAADPDDLLRRRR